MYYQYFIYFYCWIIVHCMDMYHIYPFMNMRVVPTFWLLCIALLWTFVYTCLCGCMFWFLLDICLEVELLCHRVTLCVTFWETQTFPKWLHLFKFPPAVHEDSHFTTSLSILIIYLSDYSHYLIIPSGCEVVSHCDFNLHFPCG